jgi:hypothetical protein
VGYFWLFSGLHLLWHLLGHLMCFVPMLWLGYAGMPRRVQDYPQGYTGWHSVASLGHTLVLLGLLCFLLVVAHATYFKRPAGGRHAGMPFVVTRLAFLTLDRAYAAKARRRLQLVGVGEVRAYLARSAEARCLRWRCSAGPGSFPGFGGAIPPANRRLGAEGDCVAHLRQQHRAVAASFSCLSRGAGPPRIGGRRLLR